MLGRSNLLICRECDQEKPGNFFISESLCKKCAAKRRTTAPNPTVEVAEGVLVTEATLKRLRHRAKSQTPFTWRDWLARIVPVIVIPFFWYVGIFYRNFLSYVAMLIGSQVGTPSDSGSFIFFIVWAAWMGPIPGMLGAFLPIKLSKPRGAAVQALTVELAKQRKEQIEETERFYGSPEWNALRQLVVDEQGRTCNYCGRIIKRKANVTVDHILPRSKHPELALTRSNLQVLCRRCNSRKGARLLEGEEDKSTDVIRSSLPGDVKKQKRKLRKGDEVLEKIIGDGEEAD